MHMTKRRLLHSTAALAAVFAAMSLGARAASAEELNLMAYVASFQDNYTKAVIEPFEKETGIKVNYVTPGNSAQQLAVLRAQKNNPAVDLSIVDVSVARSANKEGLFAEVDPKVVTNIADLYEPAKANLPFGPGLTFDYIGILYNTDLVKPAPVSMTELWKPEYKGQIAWASGAMDDLMPMAVLQRSLGGDYKEGVEQAFDKLAELGPSVQTWSPAPDVYTVVMNGTAKVGFGWNAFAQYYAKLSNGKLGIVAPKEGTVFQINTINLVKNGPNPDAALKFMNYALRADVQARFSELMAYAPTNQKAQLPPELLARTAASPEIMNNAMPIDWDVFAAKREGWLDMWRKRIMASQ
jgi:putative spermidine/putrescine transport system substrate-binding protein